MGQPTLTFDEMSTVLVEVEATLNNRPLTYVYDDNEGLSYALTPADLVYGHRLAISPSGRQFEVISTAKTFTKTSKYQSISSVYLTISSKMAKRIFVRLTREKSRRH